MVSFNHESGLKPEEKVSHGNALMFVNWVKRSLDASMKNKCLIEAHTDNNPLNAEWCFYEMNDRHIIFASPTINKQILFISYKGGRNPRIKVKIYDERLTEKVKEMFAFTKKQIGKFVKMELTTFHHGYNLEEKRLFN